VLEKLNFTDSYVKNFILISYLFENWRINPKKNSTIMNELEKDLMVFEFDKGIEGFHEIEFADKEVRELLNSNLIYIIVNRYNKEIWIWHGSNTNIRMKFIATQEAPKIRDKYGSDFKILAIDEGDESSEFKKIIGIIPGIISKAE